MHPLLWLFLGSFVSMFLAAMAFHLFARLGNTGRAINDWCSKAPVLDLIVFFFTHGSWLAAGHVWWHHTERGPWWFLACLATAIAAQVLTLVIWARVHEALHELKNPGARRGPRIVNSLNKSFGPLRNHAAVWWTALAVPIFTLVRIAEVVVYPVLHWLIALPKYDSGKWVNVSRQKFTGLVGHDLIWCLYCDWMTGVWSLGTEMLRNVESFWCPIRFSSPEKCENCRIDFPDINGGWVDSNATIADAAKVIDQKYPGPKGINGWFGHPSRQQVSLTINGEPPTSVP